MKGSIAMENSLKETNLLQMAGQIEYIHTRRTPSADASQQEGTRKSHRHALYEIYRFVAGDVDYFIENSMHDLEPGQLFVIRSDEFHNLSARSSAIYEKVAVRFPRELARELSMFGLDLLSCFDGRSRGSCNKVVPDERASAEISAILDKMEALFREGEEPCLALRAACLAELLVWVNRAHRATDRESPAMPAVHSKLVPVLEHIDRNLEGDLSLKTLSRQFFLSVSTLCSLFRETTGVGMHEYVTFRRVARARELLIDGVSVGEACSACGFNDYANFIRTFRKITGMPPGRFAKQAGDYTPGSGI
jgi:AraC-like DNA-binding protein/mannose-6-phosphate isomerase-like protein (cupin superfamily)